MCLGWLASRILEPRLTRELTTAEIPTQVFAMRRFALWRQMKDKEDWVNQLTFLSSEHVYAGTGRSIRNWWKRMTIADSILPMISLQGHMRLINYRMWAFAIPSDADPSLKKCRRRPFSEKMPDCLAHIQRDQLIVADLKIEYYQKNNGLGPRFPTPQIEYVPGTKKNCAGLEDRILPPCPDLKIHKLFYEWNYGISYFKIYTKIYLILWVWKRLK